MAVGEKITNEALVSAMAAMNENSTPETQQAYIAELVRAKLIIPAKIEKDDDASSVENGQKKQVKVNFCVLTNSEKKNFLPVFTDDEELGRGNYEEAKKIVITYKELSQMVLSSNGALSGIVVNPHNQGFVVPVELITAMEKSKKEFQEQQKHSNIKKNTIPVNTNIKLRTPKYPPVDMMDAAREFLMGQENVKAAYLQMMEKNDDEEYLIAIDIEGDISSVFNELMPIVRPHSFGINVALTDVKNGLGAKVAEIAEPFYKKES